MREALVSALGFVHLFDFRIKRLQGFETYGVCSRTDTQNTPLIAGRWCGQTAPRGELTKQRQLDTQPTVMSSLMGPACHNNSLQCRVHIHTATGGFWNQGSYENRLSSQKCISTEKRFKQTIWLCLGSV